MLLLSFPVGEEQSILFLTKFHVIKKELGTLQYRVMRELWRTYKEHVLWSETRERGEDGGGWGVRALFQIFKK